LNQSSKTTMIVTMYRFHVSAQHNESNNKMTATPCVLLTSLAGFDPLTTESWFWLLKTHKTVVWKKK